MPKKYETVICPKCKNRVRDYTLKKYGGVCYYCFKGHKRTSRPIKELPRETEPPEGGISEIVDLQEAKEEFAKRKIFFDKHEKVAMEQFLRWYMADPETRQPKTRREVAKVLECTQTQLDNWWASREFRQMYEQRRYDNTYYKYSHLIDEVNAKEAVKGNKDAIKKWYETYGKVEKPREGEKYGEVSEDFDKEVDKTLDQPEGSMGGVSMPEEDQKISEKMRKL